MGLRISVMKHDAVPCGAVWIGINQRLVETGE